MNADKTYFQGYDKHPQHISVGGILMNDKGEVCCHHFRTEDLKGYWPEHLPHDQFYILMRETVEPNETLEAAFHRGLMEEFGATADFVDYVGSIESHFDDHGVDIQKTTLYFLGKLKSQDISKRSSDDGEQGSTLEWHKPEFLVEKMKEQPKRFGRTDVDESSILERMMNR